jgi:hypothetical protein
MTILFGQEQSSSHPDVVTYYHTADGSISMGYWENGKLYLVQSKDNTSKVSSNENPSAKHIAITDTNQVLLINSKDYKPNKIDQYFGNIYADHSTSTATEIKGAGQTIVFKSDLKVEAESGKKDVRHTLEGLMKLLPSQSAVYLLVFRSHIILGNINNGKLEHFKIIDKDDLINLRYHTLAFYQYNDISPVTLLLHSGLTSEQTSGLQEYLPEMDELQVPAGQLSFQVTSHADLIPHYLAYSCVS